MKKNACGMSRRRWVVLSQTLFFFGISPPLAADCWVATSGQTLSPVFDTPQGALDWASALLPCPVTWSYPDTPNSYSTAGSLWWSDGLDHGVVPVAYARSVDTTCRGYVVFASNGSYYSRINNYNIPQIYPQCGAVTCPVGPLTPIDQLQPNGPDVLPLTQLLEQTRGATLALTPETETARQCLIDKALGMGVTAVTTSGTRTIAYQRHLIEVWNKMIELNRPANRTNEACRQLRQQIVAEKGCSINEGCVGACTNGSHCIRYRPAGNSKHPEGKAFDVSISTIDSLRDNLAVLQPPQSISQLLTDHPTCNLNWGGDFNDPDVVHFQLP